MSSDTNNNKTLKLAIVGCGQIVTHHLEAIVNVGATAFALVALVDPSAERRTVIRDLYASLKNKDREATSDDITDFDSLDDLLLRPVDSVDVIFIAVPHDLHERLALQALQRGPPHATIVMEKPLAPTRESCDRLVQASSDYDNRLVIAEQSPHWQEVALARRLIREGAIGQVVTAHSYYYESMRDNITSGSLEQDGVGLGWRGSLKRAGGGIAMDGGLHWIRPLREMCGRIEEVVGVVRRNLVPELRMEGALESLGHALLKIEPAATGSLQQPAGSGPLVATFSCNMLATAPMAHDKCPYFRVTGNKGELVIHGDGLFKENPGAGGLCLYDNENPKGKELFDANRKGGFFLGFSGLWMEITRICLQHDQAAAHETVTRAADDVRVVLALYKSSQSGQWERT